MGVMLKEDLCEKVARVRRVNDSVVGFFVVFEEGVLRLICWYAPQSGGSF